MARFPFVKQKDSMQCGVACIASICTYYRRKYTTQYISKICDCTSTGVSLRALKTTAEQLGFEAMCVKITKQALNSCPLPCILHWNQNHFVILYKINYAKEKYYICDPGKGLLTVKSDRFDFSWLNNGNEGIALLLDPTDNFYSQNNIETTNRYSLCFIYGYLKKYLKYISQIFLGLLFGCVLQLILPFLTQSIVDIGINNNNLGFIWLVLLGEVMIVFGRAMSDFVRRWLLLHISMRVNISLVSDFFIKLLKLPMNYFDSKLMGDLMQRVSDHGRVQAFLTNQMLSIIFTFLSFIVFGVVLLFYNRNVFGIFLCGSILYGFWIVLFLKKRKIVDYELFEQEAINQSKTYQFMTSIQEIKLQNCEKRRRWDWEDTQADLFYIQMKSLKLQQTQEVGSLFINEIKNIIITALSAAGVINGEITLGSMLAIQYIVGQLNSPIEQLMLFIYTFQDMKISLERINEVHNEIDEDNRDDLNTKFGEDKSIRFGNVDFKYEICANKKILDDISFEIPSGKITAIVGASGSVKPL